MTGPQHYREAQRLLKQSNELDVTDAPVVVAAAQVHATLALAAATAETGGLVKVGELNVPTPWAQAVQS